MGNKLNRQLVGFITGLILPVISFLVIFFVMSGTQSLAEYLNKLVSHHVLTKFLSLAVIPNLLLFYLFIWKNYQYSYRGVVGATIIIAIVILILQIAL